MERRSLVPSHSCPLFKLPLRTSLDMCGPTPLARNVESIDDRAAMCWCGEANVRREVREF